MSVESTNKVMTHYWNPGHSEVGVMAEAVVSRVMAGGQEYHTPAGVLGMLNYFYHIAFEAGATPSNLVVADGRAVWEGDFHGKHIGEFAGIPATGKEVRVPLCVVYNLENDKITHGRVYFEIPALLQQLEMKSG